MTTVISPIQLRLPVPKHIGTTHLVGRGGHRITRVLTTLRAHASAMSFVEADARGLPAPRTLVDVQVHDGEVRALVLLLPRMPRPACAGSCAALVALTEGFREGVIEKLRGALQAWVAETSTRVGHAAWARAGRSEPGVRGGGGGDGLLRVWDHGEWIKRTTAERRERAARRGARRRDQERTTRSRRARAKLSGGGQRRPRLPESSVAWREKAGARREAAPARGAVGWIETSAAAVAEARDDFRVLVAAAA